MALAHVLAWEHAEPRSSGRFLLMAQSVPWAAVAGVLRRVLPGARVPAEDALEPGPPSFPQVSSGMVARLRVCLPSFTYRSRSGI